MFFVVGASRPKEMPRVSEGYCGQRSATVSMVSWPLQQRKCRKEWWCLMFGGVLTGLTHSWLRKEL